MGVVLTSSGGFNVRSTVVTLPTSDDHGTALLTAWHTLAISVGWTVVSGTLADYTYLLTSPDGLKAWCRVRYDSTISTGRVTVQFSSVGGSNAGYLHPIQYYWPFGGTVQLGIWMNCCSVFTGVPGTMTGSSHYQYALAAGIPANNITTAPPSGACADPAHPLVQTTEMWFSTSDWTNFSGSGFRNGIYRQRWGGWSACYNGALRLAGSPVSPDSNLGDLTMIIPAVPEISSSGDTYLSKGLVWHGDVFPALCDAIIAWGDSDSSPVKIRGVLWDAVCSTGPSDGPDTGAIFGGFQWTAYNGYDSNSGWNARGTLYLYAAPAGGPGNVAY